MGHNKINGGKRETALPPENIFFSWRRFWNTVSALSEYRALPIGKVLLIPVTLLTAFYLNGLETNRP